MDNNKQSEFLLAFLQLKQALPPIHKKIEGYNYKYADLPTIISATQPTLTDHGFVINHNTRVDSDGRTILVTKLSHQPTGVVEVSEIEVNVPTNIKMNPLQSLGSALTYLKRYSYCMILGIEPDKDEDAASFEVPNEFNQSDIPQETAAPGAVVKAPRGQKITEAQVKRLYAIAYGKGYNNSDITEALHGTVGVITAAEVPYSQYDRFCKYLENNPKT